ncbi:hypothetical protein K7432_013124 [Basidiobolus ranarum]|uniref:Secreted protein n=1 Tax=Basidiobolus ranarum TaxID=34480 RepID=A0ABR2WJS8_9FUNG
MHLKLSLFVASALLTKVSVGVPLDALSSSYNIGVLPNINQLEDNSKIQSPAMQPPEFTSSKSGQSPLLKQVFNTVTRKHDNLNDARIDNDRNSNIRFQSGPSLEAEGNEVQSNQGERTDTESNGGSNIDTGMAQVAQNSGGDATNNLVPSSENIGSEAITPLKQLVSNLGQTLPQSALLDHVQGSSAQAGHALSDSNQFDQVQRIDQTLYQPSQPSQNAETPQAPDEEEPEDSGSGCRSCGCRHCGRRRRFGRRY